MASVFKNMKLKTFTNQFLYRQDRPVEKVVEMKKTRKGYRAPLLVQGGKLGYMDRRRLGRNDRRFADTQYPPSPRYYGDNTFSYVKRGSPADMQL